MKHRYHQPWFEEVEGSGMPMNFQKVGMDLRRNNPADIASLFLGVDAECFVEGNRVLGLGML